jgi:hypothetical protein
MHGKAEIIVAGKRDQGLARALDQRVMRARRDLQLPPQRAPLERAEFFGGKLFE